MGWRHWWIPARPSTYSAPSPDILLVALLYSHIGVGGGSFFLFPISRVYFLFHIIISFRKEPLLLCIFRFPSPRPCLSIFTIDPRGSTVCNSRASQRKHTRTGKIELKHRIQFKPKLASLSISEPDICQSSKEISWNRFWCLNWLSALFYKIWSLIKIKGNDISIEMDFTETKGRIKRQYEMEGIEIETINSLRLCTE